MGGGWGKGFLGWGLRVLERNEKHSKLVRINANTGLGRVWWMTFQGKQLQTSLAEDHWSCESPEVCMSVASTALNSFFCTKHCNCRTHSVRFGVVFPQAALVSMKSCKVHFRCGKSRSLMLLLPDLCSWGFC